MNQVNGIEAIEEYRIQVIVQSNVAEAKEVESFFQDLLAD